MVHSFDGFNHLIRLDKGDRLSEALLQFTKDTTCDGAWLSGIGGALEVTVGFYDLEAKAYQWQTFKGLYEIASLNGTIALDESGKTVFHLHGAFADNTFKTIGGHVKDLVAAGTVELFVHRSYKPIKRKLDPNVGLQTLDIV